MVITAPSPNLSLPPPGMGGGAGGPPPSGGAGFQSSYQGGYRPRGRGGFHHGGPRHPYHHPRGGFHGGGGQPGGFRPPWPRDHHRQEREGGVNNPRPGQQPAASSQQQDGDPQQQQQQHEAEGKRLRKSLMRKTVDYNCSFIGLIERRIWQRDARDRRAIQPDIMSYPQLLPPMGMQENPANAVTTRFVKTATNKMRCPIFTLAWTPEGRRLITGASSGEFTLWNGLTFNFETILQAHDSPVRAMVWSHNDQWMITGDHGGYVKYWQSNMNNVKMFQAHKEPVRCLTFAPTDKKFASCSDDGTIRIWDFLTCKEEKTLRGHGSDVKCVDWHPTKGLLASGSKDNQQPIKIWEPKSGRAIATLHAHKSTVMDIEWNKNGNWLLTASRDHLLKLFDIRNTKEEVQTFRGHKKEASTLAWHPVHEGVFASGGSEGSIMFWNVGADKEVGVIEQAHESIVWSLAWHPIGHILCSGSNDHTCKYWTRNRPGDSMRDKYNLNTLPFGMMEEESVSTAGDASNSVSVIPGMAPEDRVEGASVASSSIPAMSTSFDSFSSPAASASIPGLDSNAKEDVSDPFEKKIKTPYAKPIPKNFEASWNSLPGQGPPPPFNNGPPNATLNDRPNNVFNDRPNNVFSQSGGPPSMQPEDECISLEELQRQTTAVVAFGQVFPVYPGSSLSMAIRNGEHAVKEVLRNEFLPG